MPNNDLNIIIRAAIDPNQKTDDLQKSINKISEKLTFNVGIDAKQFQQLTNQISNIQKVINQQSKNLKIFDAEQIKKDGMQVFQSTNEIMQQFSKLGNALSFKNTFDPVTKELTGMTVQIEKTKGLVETLKFDLVNLAKGTDLSKAFVLSNKSEVDKVNAVLENIRIIEEKNEQKLQDQRLKNLQKIAEERSKLRSQFFEISSDKNIGNSSQVQNLGSLINSAKTTEDLNTAKVQIQNISDIQSQINEKVKQEGQERLKAYQESLKSEQQLASEIDKAHKQALADNQKLIESNTNRQKDLLISADQAHASYHGNIDTTALKNLVQQIKEIDPATGSASKKLQELQQDLRQLKVNASEAANSLSGQLKHSIVAMSTWAVGGGLFFGGVQAARDTITNISNVEKSMAGLRQTLPEIHDSQTKLNDATGQFIGIAEKYGESVSNIIDNAKLWSRQYKSLDTVIELVNSSVLLSVVDNVSLEEANKSIESIMVQMGMVIDQTKSKAEQQAQAFEYSRKIVDSFSNTSHQSMISANDLATGLERSASVAKKVGVDFDSLVGLMTASVRSTGLAGSNLGNMWKTVFGSIHDTKTAVPELEAIGVQMKQIGKDGVETWTPVADVMRQVMILTAGAQKDTEELTKAASGGRPLVICHL